MPRPGPRPYECVRRAWHSDRHQPIRGSLIQEIFRMVTEIHSSQTKKNKEWQEKLPVVVLKAEEIIYSKANSEAEYVDSQTLWDRINDAIDTIIRREESTETGDLLKPCIEAALILGCTVRRASRSQRNNNPRSYLSPSTQEPNPLPPRFPNSVNHGGSSLSGNPTSTQHIAPYYSHTMSQITMNSVPLHLDSGSLRNQDNNPSMSCAFPFSSNTLPQSASNQVFPVDVHPSQTIGHVYPLYYAAHNQTTAQQVRGTSSSSAVPDMSQCARNPTKKGFLQNFFACDGVVNASSRNIEADLADTADNPSEIECDLSLRLGPLPVPCSSMERREIYAIEDIGSSRFQEGSKSSNLSPRTSEELCFFPKENVNDPLGPSSSKWSSKNKAIHVDGSSREHESPMANLVEAAYLSHHPKFSTNLCFDRTKSPDK